LKLSDTVFIQQGDCLELMKKIPDKHVDMILCDLPYGTTACKWDTIIPFELLWEQYERIIKDGGAICLFGSEPFSSYLRTSNIKFYKYDWIWDKKQGGNFQLAKYQPLKVHENVSVFGRGSVKYYPIMQEADLSKNRPHKETLGETKGLTHMASGIYQYDKDRDEKKRFPTTIFEYHGRNAECNSLNRLHPTQKPVALLEYLIKTYTQENEIVLDNTMGVASTGVACINLNRKFIGYELDEKYFEIGKNRLIDAIKVHETQVLLGS